MPSIALTSLPAEGPTKVELWVCEVYKGFRNAYARDASGKRFLVNEGSQGVDFGSLEVGQLITAHVNERNYVDQVWPPAS